MKNNSVTISVYEGPYDCNCLICPSCGAHELVNCHVSNIDPSQYRWQIRPFKVDNYSHCLVCDCWFSPEGHIETPSGKGYGKDSKAIFEKASELVRYLTKDDNFNPSFLMKLFIAICRDEGLPMKVWDPKYADPVEDEILARGYKLLD